MKNDPRMASQEDIVCRMDEYLRAMTQISKFSGSVLLARSGQVLHSAGYGLADREHTVANTPRTKFRLGSITKQFTAMAVMLLEEQGKLSIQDAISEHLTYSPDHWQGITIHHLLNHTSGLGNLADIPGCQETTARLPLSVRELVETFRETPLEFSPGSGHRYSNSGYFLLGDIIERVSGVTYEQFLTNHIFGPLGMTDSGYDHHETVLVDRATGYRRQGGEWFRAGYLDMGFPFAAGALYSTVEDLYRWDQALLMGRLVSKQAHTRMTIVTPLLSSYGYGFVIGREHGRKTVGHAGGVNGFRANFVRFPDEPACVILLSNSEATDFRDVTQALTAILFGEEQEARTVKRPVKVADDLLASHAGTYQVVPGLTLRVESQGGYLVVTCGNARGRFLPESDTMFFHEESGDALTFHATTETGGNYLTLRQAEAELEAEKV